MCVINKDTYPFHQGDIICGVNERYRYTSSRVEAARVSQVLDHGIMLIEILEYRGDSEVNGSELIVTNSEINYKLKRDYKPPKGLDILFESLLSEVLRYEKA